MKGLLKYLSPFAPDQSGAVSVLYGMGGITVICDAGGCTGNVCGFDEPRWFRQKSALFSAGLRDMDAILGRDDRLVDKLKDAADRLQAEFAALVGTPVPAVIATDFKALTRMAEKRCQIPVVALDCTGTRLYDRGASDTYEVLFRKFAEAEIKPVKNTIGILGVNPLDTSYLESETILKKKLKEEGYETILCYGTEGLKPIIYAGSAEKNLVLSPSGLKAAQYLKKKFGTPYENAYPLLKASVREQLHTLAGKRILVVHQQVAANEIRKEILSAGEAEITAATWFLMEENLKEPGDVYLDTEEKWAKLVYENDYDVIIGDRMLKRAVREFKGEWIHIPHFAISGEYEDEE